MLYIVKQILLIKDKRNALRKVWRVCILMLGCKGLLISSHQSKWGVMLSISYTNISNCNRIEWSLIRSTTVQWVPDLFIMSMITDRIGQHKVLYQLIIKLQFLRKEELPSNEQKGKFAFKKWQRRHEWIAGC